MVATRTARRAAHNRSLPFLALWRRDDVTDSVVDFLPTKTIAVLPIVAKPLRDAQQRVLLTAVRRRGKTLPGPRSTRALLETLIVGEPRYFREDWEGGLEQWRESAGYTAAAAVGRGNSGAAYTVKPFHGGGRCLEIDKAGYYENESHKGVSRRIHGENLRVTRLRVTMSYVNMVDAVGYLLLCGPPRGPGLAYNALHNSMGGPKFDRDDDDVETLVWFRPGCTPVTIQLLEATPNTAYTVDAVFHVESETCCSGSVDVSVNGQQLVQGVPFDHVPLSRVHAYNFSSGTSKMGEIEVWYEAAHSSDQSSDPRPGLPAGGDSSEESD